MFRKLQIVILALIQASNEGQITTQSWDMPINKKFTQVHATNSLYHPIPELPVQ